MFLWRCSCGGAFVVFKTAQRRVPAKKALPLKTVIKNCLKIVIKDCPKFCWRDGCL